MPRQLMPKAPTGFLRRVALHVFSTVFGSIVLAVWNWMPLAECLNRQVSHRQRPHSFRPCGFRFCVGSTRRRLRKRWRRVCSGGTSGSGPAPESRRVVDLTARTTPDLERAPRMDAVEPPGHCSANIEWRRRRLRSQAARDQRIRVVYIRALWPPWPVICFQFKSIHDENSLFKVIYPRIFSCTDFVN